MQLSAGNGGQLLLLWHQPLMCMVRLNRCRRRSELMVVADAGAIAPAHPGTAQQRRDAAPSSDCSLKRAAPHLCACACQHPKPAPGAKLHVTAPSHSPCHTAALQPCAACWQTRTAVDPRTGARGTAARSTRPTAAAAAARGLGAQGPEPTAIAPRSQSVLASCNTSRQQAGVGAHPCKACSSANPRDCIITGPYPYPSRACTPKAQGQVPAASEGLHMQ